MTEQYANHQKAHELKVKQATEITLIINEKIDELKQHDTDNVIKVEEIASTIKSYNEYNTDTTEYDCFFSTDVPPRKQASFNINGDDVEIEIIFPQSTKRTALESNQAVFGITSKHNNYSRRTWKRISTVMENITGMIARAQLESDAEQATNDLVAATVAQLESMYPHLDVIVGQTWSRPVIVTYALESEFGKVEYTSHMEDGKVVLKIHNLTPAEELQNTVADLILG